MHKENFVVSIKSGGKFLSESKGEVLIPFLSEYSIFLKNKNSKRASVCVEIDGKDVLNGERITINPGESFDLERFFDEDIDNGRKFRFIEKTDSIIYYRGNQPEDGLIRVSFRYENESKYYINTSPFIKRNEFPFGGPTCGGGLLRDVLDGSVIPNKSSVRFNCGCDGSHPFEKMFSKLKAIDVVKAFGFDEGREEDRSKKTDFSGVDSAYVSFTPKIDLPEFETVSFSSDEPKAGITVKGSASDQKLKKTFFVDTYGSEEFVIMLKLSGVDKNAIAVEVPVAKDSKKICPSCGKKWDYSFTYCSDDATYLTIPKN